MGTGRARRTAKTASAAIRAALTVVAVVAAVVAADVGPAERAAGAAPHDPPPLSKLDPTMRAAVRSGPNDRAVRFFVRSRDTAATAAAIGGAGGSVGTIAGDVVTARAAIGAVTAIAAAPHVVHVEAAHAVHPRLDRALAAIHADDVHAGRAPIDRPRGGAGVLVGVVDYGLDASHAAFARPDGTSRIVAAWEQNGVGTPPAGYDYGTACGGASCLAPPADVHGTHVASLAAGGYVEGAPYVGVAPDADIAFVDLDPVTDASEATICDGVAWIFRVAAARGVPAVANLSLGNHAGPHDGTSLADRCLDNLAGPGRIVVAAAGNEGAEIPASYLRAPIALHASGIATATPKHFSFAAGLTGGEHLYLWADAGVDLHLRVGVYLPGGTPIFTPTFGFDAPLAPTMLDLPAGYPSLGPVSSSDGVSAGGSRGIDVLAIGDVFGKVLLLAPWVVEITGTGRFDAFVDTTDGGGLASNPPDVVADTAMSIGYPAEAARVLAVGSFVSRTHWDALGVAADEPDTYDVPPVVGALSAFTSRGPTRNPSVTGPKPDIVAPGQAIVGALAAGAPTDGPTVVRAPPNGYVVLSGTSMASPVAAGVVALMLEAKRDLDVDAIRAVLAATADVPAGVVAPDVAWGRGRIDARAAVARLLPRGAAPAAASDPPPSLAPGGCAASPGIAGAHGGTGGSRGAFGDGSRGAFVGGFGAFAGGFGAFGGGLGAFAVAALSAVAALRRSRRSRSARRAR